MRVSQRPESQNRAFCGVIRLAFLTIVHRGETRYVKYLSAIDRRHASIGVALAGGWADSIQNCKVGSR